MKNKLYIFIIIVSTMVMAIIDAYIKPGYLTKSFIKIIFFLIIPMIYLIKYDKKTLKKIFKINKRGIINAFILGIIIFISILGGFLLTRNIFDYSNITGTLTNDLNVTKENFVYVSIYISICNSLLEEFFFRGFIFLELKRKVKTMKASIISATIFMIYHISMMIGWFNIYLLLLILLGLLFGGLVFNYLANRRENIYYSWVSHMFANFSINTIGFILFNIIKL